MLASWRRRLSIRGLLFVMVGDYSHDTLYVWCSSGVFSDRKKGCKLGVVVLYSRLKGPGKLCHSNGFRIRRLWGYPLHPDSLQGPIT